MLRSDSAQVAEASAIRYPLLPLRDMVIFPGSVTSIFVGREKSMEINNKKKRTSLGMQIIQDKVVTIDHLSANKIKIEIKDYSLEKDQRTGTCVKLIYSKS